MLFLFRLRFVVIFSFIIYCSLLSDIKLNANSNKLPSFYFGNAEAPVTIYEFLSLSCIYCKENINLFIPQNNKDNPISKLIADGKVKLVIMDFPINGKVDILAHTILYYSKTNEQFFKLLKLFLYNQGKWLRSNNPYEVIINYGKLCGLTDKDIEKYEKDTKIPQLIINNANMFKSKYNINATPITIIEKSNVPITDNSYKELGIVRARNVEKAINNLLNK